MNETIDTNIIRDTILVDFVMDVSMEINGSLARLMTAMRKTMNDVILRFNTQHEEHALFVNGITCITGPGLAWFRVVGDRVGSFMPDRTACCRARKACSSSA